MDNIQFYPLELRDWQNITKNFLDRKGKYIAYKLCDEFDTNYLLRLPELPAITANKVITLDKSREVILYIYFLESFKKQKERFIFCEKFKPKHYHNSLLVCPGCGNRLYCWGKQILGWGYAHPPNSPYFLRHCCCCGYVMRIEFTKPENNDFRSYYLQTQKYIRDARIDINKYYSDNINFGLPRRWGKLKLANKTFHKLCPTFYIRYRKV